MKRLLRAAFWGTLAGILAYVVARWHWDPQVAMGVGMTWYAAMDLHANWVRRRGEEPLEVKIVVELPARGYISMN
jgi:hypothetical protein